jgi:hypothetical protein
MRHWITAVGAIIAVLVLAVGTYAATTTLSGEVLNYEAGKAISVRDFNGKVHDLQITKDTKVDANIKVGSRVSIEAEGEKAQSVKVAFSRPGGSAPAPGMGG